MQPGHRLARRVTRLHQHRRRAASRVERLREFRREPGLHVAKNLEFAKRLNHAGVPVDLHLYPGGPHGFDGIVPNTTLARRARKETDEWLASRLPRRG